MKKIIVVTGASSGLGKEFIYQISEKEKVDEIWAIARNKDKLEECNNITILHSVIYCLSFNAENI